MVCSHLFSNDKLMDHLLTGLSFKPESSSLPPLPGLLGMSSLASLIPSGLPNLTSLPSLPGMSLPMMTGIFSGHPDLEMTSHLDSSMAFTSRRTHSMSSISPEESRYSPYCHSQGQSRSPSPPYRTSKAGHSYDYTGQSDHMSGHSNGGKVRLVTIYSVTSCSQFTLSHQKKNDRVLKF
jgi:hypothetical protein